MKRGAPDHWKMRELARLLKVPVRYALPFANGVMERLWHYTAKYHPQGDIGRAPDWAIAEACGWPAKDASELVSALATSGWLDASSSHRLLVHDWREHADEGVKKWLNRNGLEFFCPDKISLVGGNRQPALAFALPQPLPQPQPEAERVVVVETQGAVRERFPTANQTFARKLAAKVHKTCPDATDSEIAEAVRLAWFTTQKSAGGYLETVPAVVETIRARGRDSPDVETEQSQAFERARELWQRLGLEDRVELEKEWPQLRSEGAHDGEKHAS